jgi:hypothetical protein
MSKLWSKRSIVIKNLHKKYKVDTCKKNYKKDVDVDDDLDLDVDLDLDLDLVQDLDYKIIENLDTDADIKNVIYGFINKNYILVNNRVNIYSDELLDVLLKNTTCIIFTRKNNEHNFKLQQLNDAIIGLVFFNKDYFCSKVFKRNFEITNQTPYINVKLLCLCSGFYNSYNVNFMIKCIIKAYSTKNNETIECVIYKLNRPILLSYFCKKSYYCRPINIDHIITNKNRSFSFNMKINLPLIKKLYNTFSYPVYFRNTFHLEFFLDLKDKRPDEKWLFVDTIFNLLNNYRSNTYTIYKSYTKQDIEEMLSNRNFYKFIIRDQNNVINNFICLYCYDNTNCKNAMVYSIFLKHLSSDYISYILEFISEYCYNNNLCDMICLENFIDIFGYKIYKLSKMNLDCYYYCEQFNKINPCKNGLISL